MLKTRDRISTYFPELSTDQTNRPAHKGTAFFIGLAFVLMCLSGYLFGELSGYRQSANAVETNVRLLESQIATLATKNEVLDVRIEKYHSWTRRQNETLLANQLAIGAALAPMKKLVEQPQASRGKLQIMPSSSGPIIDPGTVDDLVLEIPAGPAIPVLGHWRVKGVDRAGTQWESPLVFNAYPGKNSIAGYFQWTGHARSGRVLESTESFTGTHDPATGSIRLQGVSLSNPRGFELGTYTATMTAGGIRIVSGRFSAPRGIPGTWTADFVSEI